MALVEGARVLGRYEVVSRLGSGGMATVYRCLDLESGGHVALKCLHPHLVVDSPDTVRRFRQEAEIMLSLSHPQPHGNVAAAFALVEEGTLLAFVMEEIQGEGSLDAFLLRHGPLGEEQALEIIHGVLAGLSHIHARGVVHRDLKPGNILLATTSTGVLLPKLSDFGIAKRHDSVDVALAHTLTQTQSTFGSPAYMAPELFDSAAAASPASDVYAAGVLLFEMLTGTVPFVVDSVPSHVLRVATQAAPLLSSHRQEISGDVVWAVSRALAKEARQRFPSASAFRDALWGEGLAVAPALPSTLGQDYTVLRRIGRGPLGAVYACRDRSLEVPVAVKLLASRDDGVRQRFVAALQRQSQMHQGRVHPSLVALRHVLAEGDECGCVLDYVDGMPLDRYVVAEALSRIDLYRLFLEVCDALHSAHSLGVVHGNLKPTNILIIPASHGAFARAKVSDFCMGEVDPAGRASGSAFLAPEQRQGLDALPASDVFALARLFSLAVLNLSDDAVAWDGGAAGNSLDGLGLPESLRVTLVAALADDPLLRPPLSELARAVAEALEGEVPQHRDEAQGGQRPAWRWSVLLLLVVGLAAGAYFGWSWWQGERPQAVMPRVPEVAGVATRVEADGGEVAEEVVSPPPVAVLDVRAEVDQLFASGNEVVSECLSQCLRQALTEKNPALATLGEGVMSLELLAEVDAQGQVKSLRVVQDELAAFGMGDCVRARVETWSFPGSGREETYQKAWLIPIGGR